MDRILALSARATDIVQQVRAKLLAPETRKVAPSFTTAQLAALCATDKAHINYRVAASEKASVATA